MRRKVLKRGWIAGTLLLAGGFSVQAAAQQYILEVQQPTGENPFTRHVYVCGTCGLDQFADVAAPPGFVKAQSKLFLADASSAVFPTAPPGVAQSLDLVLDIPGDDFGYIARVTGGELLGIVPGFGPLATSSVERQVRFRYDAGGVVHELADPDGFRWILFAFDLQLMDDFDVEQIGSLATLPIPAGWSYESRVLEQDLFIDSQGLARVLAQGQLNNWQRYDPAQVPEPATAALHGAALATLALVGCRSRPRQRDSV